MNLKPIFLLSILTVCFSAQAQTPAPVAAPAPTIEHQIQGHHKVHANPEQRAALRQSVSEFHKAKDDKAEATQIARQDLKTGNTADAKIQQDRVAKDAKVMMDIKVQIKAERKALKMAKRERIQHRREKWEAHRDHREHKEQGPTS